MSDDVRVRGFPGLRVHAARQIQGEDDSSPRDRFDDGLSGTSQARLATDAGDAIEHEFRCRQGRRGTRIKCIRNPMHLAARRQEHPHATLMCDVANQEGADLGTARTQMATSEKGVTTIVARAYQQDDVATVDTAEA